MEILLNKNLLRSAIARNGYTQEMLAKMLGISANTLSSRMNGDSSFNIDEVDKICKILGIISNSEKIDIFLASESQMWDNNSVANPDTA